LNAITPTDVIDCVSWIIGITLVPLAIVFTVWFLLIRSPEKVGFFLNLLRNAVFIFIALFVLFFYTLLISMSWPPQWLERIQHRKIVLQRVQIAGGWESIKNDCEGIIQTNCTTGYGWFRGITNNPTLPKSIALLQPRQIQLWPEANGMQSLEIKIFGGHATGGRGEDYYGFKVVCPPPANVQLPFPFDPKAKVEFKGREVTNGVYEVTGGS
jgi:hypothetical protein